MSHAISLRGRAALSVISLAYFLSLLPSVAIAAVLVTEYGATANDGSNDTAAFEKALAASAEVTVPAGTFLIQNLKLPSGKTLRGAGPSTVLKLPGGNTYMRSVLRVENVSNAAILDLTIDGNRVAQNLTDDNLRGQTAPGVGENGGMHGIAVAGSGYVEIRNVVTKNNWTDGVLLWKNSHDITIANVTADNNRRQGMSTGAIRDVVVRDTTFKNTNGRFPGAGVDIETDGPSANVVNVTFSRVTFSGNWGRGFVVDHKGGTVDTLVVENSKFFGNGQAKDVSSSVIGFTYNEPNDIALNGRKISGSKSLLKNIYVRNNDIERGVQMSQNKSGEATLTNIRIEGNKVVGHVRSLNTASTDTIIVRDNCIEGGISGAGISASNNKTDCDGFATSGGAGDGTTGGTTGTIPSGRCDAYLSGDGPPANYGAAWNTLSARKELLISAVCREDGGVEYHVGPGQAFTNFYVYQTGYVFDASWKPFTLSGPFAVGSAEWIIGNGQNKTLNTPVGSYYWVAYVCQWTGVAWKCGCRDGACATNYWQLQRVRR